MANKKYLIFDFGQTSIKALIGYYDGKKIWLKEIYRFSNNHIYAGGYLQWNILGLYSVVLESIKKAKNRGRDLAGIGIDSWGTDHSFIDKNGYLIGNPITNRDSRVKEHMDSFYKIISKKELFKITGVQLSPASSSSLMQLHSLISSGSSILELDTRYLMIPDIINYFLSGVPVLEHTIMSFTQTIDQNKRKLSDYILKKYSIPEKIFPEIIDPGTEIGSLGDSLCESLGIEPLKIISVVSHDTASAFSAVPFGIDKENIAAISMGTWCVVGTEVSEPITTDEAFVNGFSNQGGAEGVYHLRNDMPGLMIAEQLMNKIIREKQKNISWPEIISIASSAKAFKGFINVSNPIFGKPDSDIREIFNNYFISTRQKPLQEDGELFRCIFESLVFRYKYSLDLLQRINKKKTDKIYTIGGGSRNELLNQWTANVLGVPVISGIYEAASLGNMLSQMKAIGDIGSIRRESDIVCRSMELKEYLPENEKEFKKAYSDYLEILELEKKI